MCLITLPRDTHLVANGTVRGVRYGNTHAGEDETNANAWCRREAKQQFDGTGSANVFALGVELVLPSIIGSILEEPHPIELSSQRPRHGALCNDGTWSRCRHLAFTHIKHANLLGGK